MSAQNSEGSMAHRIQTKLHDAFSPDQLEVIDDSESHRGHGGWREGGETHFRVRIISAQFEGKSRIDRHRAVNGCLRDELAESVHALEIAALTPIEALNK